MSSLNSFATLQNVLLILVKNLCREQLFISHLSKLSIFFCFKTLLLVPKDTPLNH